MSCAGNWPASGPLSPRYTWERPTPRRQTARTSPGRPHADVAHAALDGIEADAFEVVIDEFTVMAKASLRRSSSWSENDA